MGSNICPDPMKATSNGAFQGDNPLDFALPLAILQICLVLVVTRVLAFLMKPLRQPRVIAEIIGGIILGPSVLGRNKNYLEAVFPSKSLTVLETLANLGLLFFLFLAGLELDPKSIRRTGKQALGIAIAGISLPFALGIGSSLVLRNTIAKNVDGPAFVVFMGVALSITAFPVLARILAELKLLTTELGRIAMSAAAVNDVAAWVLLALAVAMSGTGKSQSSTLVPLWVFLSGASFVAILALFAPPALKFVARRCREGEPVDEIYVCAVLAAVLAAGFATDAIGIHAMFGAFVVGVLVPKEGPLAGALVEKLEDLVSGLLLPLYFVSSGLKTDVATISGLQSWGLLLLVTFTACLGKILGTFLVSVFCRVPVREALALGFLMNTKGLVELIVLNIGKDRKVLNEETFAIMILMAILTTFMTTPLVVWVYEPAREEEEYKKRKVEGNESQLRIMACFHSAGNIPSLLNLLEYSRGSGELCVYALHLKQFSERSSSILMVQRARRDGLPFWNRSAVPENSDNVVVAFEAYGRLGRVQVRPMTAISSLPRMHDDVCSTASARRAALLILPFSGGPHRNEFHGVNRRVLERSPCSVALFHDRGLGGPAHVAARHVSSRVAAVFFGGPDDREALACGARMARHPGVRLSVLLFSSPPPAAEDEAFLAELRRSSDEDESVSFVDESRARGAEEVAEALRGVECDLFLVGRAPGGEAGLVGSGYCFCPEVGPVGKMLASPEFPTGASVLVVQQYDGGGGRAPAMSLESV